MASRGIYLDYGSTTPLDGRVRRRMEPWLGPLVGNPASNHAAGQAAKEDVEAARREVADLIGSRTREITFCSGATESINLALQGVMSADARRRLVVAAAEHKAVLDTARVLERRGRVALTVVGVDSSGRVDLGALRATLSDDVSLVSVMAANNETGTLNPVRAVADLAHSYGALFHCDATQRVGKLPVDVETMDVDLLSLSSHKFHGPQGVGALYVRQRPRRVELEPIMYGGGQERDLRPGTSNVAGIVGIGAAAEIAVAEMPDEALQVACFRDRLWTHLDSELPRIERNGHLSECLPGTLNVRFGVDAEAILGHLEGIACSTGSACTSAVPAPSHVLLAMGLSETQARSSLRLSLGRFTTQDEIDVAAERLVAAVRKASRLATTA